MYFMINLLDFCKYLAYHNGVDRHQINILFIILLLRRILMKIIKKLTMALGVSVMSVGVAQALDTIDYMEISRQNANEQGYYNTGFAHHDTLSQGSKRTYFMSTEAGRRYAVIGVCDTDCRDLDIAIIKDGTVVEKDYLTDDNPIVQFTAHASGYEVRVDMEDCSTNYCFFRVEGFKK